MVSPEGSTCCCMEEKRGERPKETSWCWKKDYDDEDIEEAVFDWISEMRAGNLRFIMPYHSGTTIIIKYYI